MQDLSILSSSRPRDSYSFMQPWLFNILFGFLILVPVALRAAQINTNHFPAADSNLTTSLAYTTSQATTQNSTLFLKFRSDPSPDFILGTPSDTALANLLSTYHVLQIHYRFQLPQEEQFLPQLRWVQRKLLANPKEFGFYRYYRLTLAHDIDLATAEAAFATHPLVESAEGLATNIAPGALATEASFPLYRLGAITVRFHRPLQRPLSPLDTGDTSLDTLLDQYHAKSISFLWPPLPTPPTLSQTEYERRLRIEASKARAGLNRTYIIEIPTYIDHQKLVSELRALVLTEEAGVLDLPFAADG